jgi:hypothetical protein
VFTFHRHERLTQIIFGSANFHFIHAQAIYAVCTALILCVTDAWASIEFITRSNVLIASLYLYLSLVTMNSASFFSTHKETRPNLIWNLYTNSVV